MAYAATARSTRDEHRKGVIQRWSKRGRKQVQRQRQGGDINEQQQPRCRLPMLREIGAPTRPMLPFGKNCSNCGKNGHIAAICTAKPKGRKADAQVVPEKTFQQVVTGTTDYKASWFCHSCNIQVFDAKLTRCPGCKAARLRTKDKQTIAKDVEDILQKADAAEHLELLEAEEKVFENIREINASIEAAQKRGNSSTVDILQKDLAEEKKKLKKPSVEKAQDVKAVAGESVRLEKQYDYERKRLTEKLAEDHAALKEYDIKKATRMKELERNYLESVQAFEESYQGWVETTKLDIKTNKEKLATMKEEHEKIKLKLKENIVLNTAEDVAVLPSTITQNFMQECIASQPSLANVTKEQSEALISMFRMFCDKAVQVQIKTKSPRHRRARQERHAAE